LDPAIRQNLHITFENAIIIIDEAHNVEDVCRDTASLDAQLEDLQNGRTTLPPSPPNVFPSPSRLTALWHSS
jgi:Rad3-related DNA helicase